MGGSIHNCRHFTDQCCVVQSDTASIAPSQLSLFSVVQFSYVEFDPVCRRKHVGKEDTCAGTRVFIVNAEGQ